MSTDSMAEFTKMPASDDAFYERVLDFEFCIQNYFRKLTPRVNFELIFVFTLKINSENQLRTWKLTPKINSAAKN